MEDEKVLCPYCGNEMSLFKPLRERWARTFCSSYYCAKCGSNSPICRENAPEVAIKNARTVALKWYRPMQKPMTVEELREMPLLDWVWIEILKPSAFEHFAFAECKSAYYAKHYDDYTNGEAFCCGYPGMGYGYDYCDYGKTWIAFRRDPTDAERDAAKMEEIC